MTQSDAASTLKGLVSEYEMAAELHGRGTHCGDYRLANSGYERLANAYRMLRDLGTMGQEALLLLLAHSAPSMISWAATLALEFGPQRGEQVLEHIAAGPPSPERLSAQMTLKNWRNGQLRFP